MRQKPQGDIFERQAPGRAGPLCDRLRDQVTRRAVGAHYAVDQERYTITPFRFPQIVSGDQSSATGLRHRDDVRPYLLLGGKVETGGRLIEQLWARYPIS